MASVVNEYLGLLDVQREFAFAALAGLDDSQLWQRPIPREWSIGEILDHNYLLSMSFLPIVKWIWKFGAWYGRLRRSRPYKTEVNDLYRDPRFPNWVGFLWIPRYKKHKPVSLAVLQAETENLHTQIHEFYDNKDEDVLGNLHLYDPIFGWCNLIVTLRICIYHDQLHYDDVIKQAAQLKS